MCRGVENVESYAHTLTAAYVNHVNKHIYRTRIKTVEIISAESIETHKHEFIRKMYFILSDSTDMISIVIKSIENLRFKPFKSETFHWHQSLY